MALQIVRYESIATLRKAESAWDDLWERSEATLPTGRAELIAQWLEQFAPQSKFIAVAVEQDGQLVAALPLVERRIKHLVSAGSLPRNDWCWAGDLLVDPEADVPRVLSALVDEIRRLPWPLLWFDTIPFEQPRWQQLLAVLDRQQLSYAVKERFRMGTVEIVEQLACDQAYYQAAWSGNHRRHMRKAMRRAKEEGGVMLDIRRPHAPDEVEAQLREGFEVEHRSWKGRDGTSVMNLPEQWEFYLRQATQIARYGQLELVFLRHQDRAIAFEYGWKSKGIYFTPKVGFDDTFSCLSPGQLLRYLLIEQAFVRPDRRSIDFLGPLCAATAKWSTNSYPVGRLVFETGGAGGRMMLCGLRDIWGRISSARKKAAAEELDIIHLEPRKQAPLSAAADHA
jgi:CelD/BcsL family acetyltransferase involved in cellulose biosynthesis